MTSPTLYSMPNCTDDKPLIKLIVDNNTAVQIGDKPIFGVEVTISEDIIELKGKVMRPGAILGWVNYIDESKFACLTTDNHYVEAANYLQMKQNQIVLSRAIRIESVEDDMKKSNQILTFSEAS